MERSRAALSAPASNPRRYLDVRWYLDVRRGRIGRRPCVARAGAAARGGARGDQRALVHRSSRADACAYSALALRIQRSARAVDGAAGSRIGAAAGGVSTAAAWRSCRPRHAQQHQRECRGGRGLGGAAVRTSPCRCGGDGMTWHDARSGRGACARKEEALRSAEGKRGEGGRDRALSRRACSCVAKRY